VAGFSLSPDLAGVKTVGLEETGFGVVGQIGGNDNFYELSAKFRIEDGEDHFYAAVKVAGHEIGASEKNKGIPTIREKVDTTVFEKAVDNAVDMDVIADCLQAGAEAADSPYKQVDWNAFL